MRLQYQDEKIAARRPHLSEHEHQAEEDSFAALQAARLYLMLCSTGQMDVALALERVQQWHGLHQLPAIRALEGALLGVQAEHATWPLEQYQGALNALAVLDEAVEDHPDDIEVRYVRALTLLGLPIFFNKRGQLRQDAKWLAKQLDRLEDSGDGELYLDVLDFLLSGGLLNPLDKAGVQQRRRKLG